MRRREFIAGLGVVALACGLSGVLGEVNSRHDGSPSHWNGYGFGAASNYRQPIARAAFQATVPFSQVLS